MSSHIYYFCKEMIYCFYGEQSYIFLAIHTSKDVYIMRKNVSKGVNGSTCNLVSKSKLLNRPKKEKRQMIAAFSV